MKPEERRLHEQEEISSSETSAPAGLGGSSGPAGTDADARSASRSWKTRVQHVSLRTKLVAPLVALSVLPVLAIGIFTISHMRRTLKEVLLQRIEFETVSKARTLESFLQGLHRDLRVLSQIRELNELARAEAAGESGRVSSLRSAAERELAIFSQGREGYGQIRYLNSAAEEVLRLQAVEGLSRLVPAAELQEGSDPHYLEAAFAMEPGQIYISQLGVSQSSTDGLGNQKPVLSCATPVVWNEAQERGLLVVNVDAPYMFSLVGRLPPGAEAWLVDQNGIYLGYMGESEEKRILYNMAKQRPVSADFTASEFATILTNRRRQHSLQTDQALVSFAPIVFDAQLAGQRWTLMIAHPIGPVYAPVRRLTVVLWGVIAFVLAVALITGVLVAYYVSRPIAKLRSATRQIAAGDLTRQVAVATGDEIEGLAMDFNTMTVRLRAAHERLATWNEELRREVARKTGYLRRLQTGLARADKLASVGQMAASIMHEIGNPLAAIKTKIQVAEEGGKLGPPCQVVLDELIQEVDRLTTVLRSFSRFGKLREPVFEAVALDEVVQGVITLVTPELERKGVSLRIASAEDVPRIRGDADQLRQLLINFILNAAEASRDGGEIRVRVQRAECTGGEDPVCWANIEIADDGIGIAPENMERVWDPLFTSRADGTGLGLAICRQIVRDHGGKVRLESELGSGTMISVDFPGLE